MASILTHARTLERSYQNLTAARKTAQEKHEYDSTKAREELQTAFTHKFGKPAFDWQLDVSEAIHLGLDSVVIAGTGSGKTMPFIMPLLMDKPKKALIITPLKALMEEQVLRFRKMGISAVAVNGDTWKKPEIRKRVREGRFRAIVTSPEMCLENNEMRQILSDTAVANQMGSIVIDEAHCISQWGGEFRKEYSGLDKLRAFFPVNVPMLITSATLTPAALRDIQSNLNFFIDDTFFLNHGNDRPNIRMSVQTVQTPDDYEALLPLLSRNRQIPEIASDIILPEVSSSSYEITMSMSLSAIVVARKSI